MTDNPILEIASNNYEEETAYTQFLDQKASNQVGFAGIITGIMGTMYGYGLFNSDIRTVHPQNIEFLLLGLILLIISIAIGILALTPFLKTRRLFNIQKFYDYYKDESNEEQIKAILPVYFLLINETKRINNQKAIILYCGSACMLAGIIFSFISVLQLFKVIG